jgi:hypothetical protein
LPDFYFLKILTLISGCGLPLCFLRRRYAALFLAARCSS